LIRHFLNTIKWILSEIIASYIDGKELRAIADEQHRKDKKMDAYHPLL
jgi:hypothetical protein